MIEIIIAVWFGCGILATLFTIIATAFERELRESLTLDAIFAFPFFLFMGPIGLVVLGHIFIDTERFKSMMKTRRWHMIRKKERLVCPEGQQR